MADNKLFRRKGSDVWQCWIPKEGGGFRRVSTGCSDKRAAATVQARLEREAVDPALTAAKRATTEEILGDYYVSREIAGRAADSLAHILKKSKNLVRLLPKMASEITHPAVTAYAGARLKEWAKAPVVDENDVVVSPGRTVRRTTLLKELRVLKPALALARKNGKFLADPDEVIPDIDDDHEDGTRWLTQLEVVLLALVLPPRRMAVVAYAVATGCDPQALWRARRSDVSADLRMAQIHGRKRKTRERPAHLPLPEQRALLAWALDHADAPKDSDEPLFLPWVNMVRDLAIACRKLGIPSCNRNDLRRSYGSWLRQAGIESEHIGLSMGHADSRMVERVYGKMPPESLAALLKDRERTVLLMRSGSDANGPSHAPLADRGPQQVPVKTLDRAVLAEPVLADNGDFQSPALPTELPAQVSGTTGEVVQEDDPKQGGCAVGALCKNGGRLPPWVHEATSNLYQLLAERRVA